MSSVDQERASGVVILPCQEDLSRFAPPYTPIPFTAEQRRYLKPFFTNADRLVVIAVNLPEEVAGALSSRFSRSTEDMRTMFLKEYIGPIIHPERTKLWERLDDQQRAAALDLRQEFEEAVDFFNRTGGIEGVVNVQRGRRFFKEWLAGYGDDSIAEESGVHVSLEGASNILQEELVNKRIGLSPLIKSSRYVSFSKRRPDGEYGYVIPGELTGTPLEGEYRTAADLLFKTYADVEQPYYEYICGLFPQGEDEPEKAFARSRGAKRFDDIRDLLPFATQTNIALFGNTRSYEELINRFLAHPLGEVRWWGQALLQEFSTTVPSLVSRPATDRGAAVQHYRKSINSLRDQLNQEIFGEDEQAQDFPRWVRLISSTEEPEVAVLSAFLLAGNEGQSMDKIVKKVKEMDPVVRDGYLAKILRERKMGNPDANRDEVRFRKVPRAWENTHFLFEIYGRGGDFRDLHRHRMLTEEHSKFTTRWGSDLEREVLESPFVDRIKTALEQAAFTHELLKKVSPDVAQYIVPFGYVQRWYWDLTAREVYWIGELRTGPQARSHYKEVVLQIVDKARAISPALFQGLQEDRDDHRLARRESEQKIERKLKALSV